MFSKAGRAPVVSLCGRSKEIRRSGRRGGPCATSSMTRPGEHKAVSERPADKPPLPSRTVSDDREGGRHVLFLVSCFMFQLGQKLSDELRKSRRPYLMVQYAPIILQEPALSSQRFIARISACPWFGCDQLQARNDLSFCALARPAQLRCVEV